MGYIQELESLAGNLDFTKQELKALYEFSDWAVALKQGHEKGLKNRDLISAVRKLKAHKLFDEYKRLINRHLNDTIDDFFRDIDG